MSQMMGPSSHPPAGRPGQMTAVMRAMSAQAGPKVLRIGLVTSGRIVEERIVKQRTTVTVGASEKAMFVIQASQIPAQFKLFELIEGGYSLNFLDGMTGRVALATGITDLNAMKGHARRVGNAYQVKLTEDARGKVVIGETTFLFQFVAPPPIQPRPQLPLAVKGGNQIDWRLVIICSFTYLFHFAPLGYLFSDWNDQTISDAGAVTLVCQQRKNDFVTPETKPTETSTATTPDTAATASAPATQAQTQPAAQQPANAPAPVNTAQLMGDVQQLLLKKFGAFDVNSSGVAPFGTSVSAPVAVGAIAANSDGSTTDTGLNTGAGGHGGTIQPGTQGGTQNVVGGNTITTAPTGTADTTNIVGVVGGGVSSAPGNLPCASAPVNPIWKTLS